MSFRDMQEVYCDSLLAEIKTSGFVKNSWTFTKEEEDINVEFNFIRNYISWVYNITFF